MDDHHAWQLQRALQRQQLADGGVARQIGAARPIREAARRAEHVHVAIAGMERQFEPIIRYPMRLVVYSNYLSTLTTDTRAVQDHF